MISNVRVFSSVARGEDKEGSDLDLYVDVGPEATYFDLGGFREEMVELLDMSVDILTSGPHVRGFLKKHIENDIKPLFSDKITENSSPCL